MKPVKLMNLQFQLSISPEGKLRHEIRRVITDDEFSYIAGCMLETFLNTNNIPSLGVDEDIKLVFNDDDLIREFACCLINQINTFVNYPEEIRIIESEE